ncbi:MAG: hypothetical protein EPO20_06320 [Betaproteobacteria bacterium]|nr:MAG: hypothetical protein EPO20_06320 [Betaproteobacteria bacterium]
MALKDWFLRVIEAAVPQGYEVKMREAAGVTIDADEDQWRKLSGDATRDLTPLTQSRMQKTAHFLWEANLLANRLIELPVAYLLAEGVQLKVNDEDNQKTLDAFWRDPINEMDIKLPKKVRELSLFGEQVYPVFVNEHDGHVRLGYLDPALIAEVVMDPDNKEQPIGIVTTRDAKGNYRKYRVIINGEEDVFTLRTQGARAKFTDGDAFYFRVNDLSSGRRGRSDILAQADWLDAYDQFLFGELDRADFLRAFVWDVTLKGANEKEVKKRAGEITPPKPGSVRVHNDAETWDAVTPDLKSADTAQGARLFRNHVLGGATMPETWFGGGGDVNRATAGEMNEPTFKIYTMRQKMWKHILESIGRYVLWQKAKAENATVDFGDDQWKVEAQFPELAARDVAKYATALQQVIAACAIAIAQKLLTRRTAVMLINAIAKLIGVEIDADNELADAEQEAAKAAEGDTFITPPTDAAPGTTAAD